MKSLNLTAMIALYSYLYSNQYMCKGLCVIIQSTFLWKAKNIYRLLAFKAYASYYQECLGREISKSALLKTKALTKKLCRISCEWQRLELSMSPIRNRLLFLEQNWQRHMIHNLASLLKLPNTKTSPSHLLQCSGFIN